MTNENERHNEVTYMFRAEDIRKILDGEPEYLLIKTSIEPRTIRREYEGKDESRGAYTEQVGVVVVTAEGFKLESTSIGTATGCPVPPCKTR